MKQKIKKEKRLSKKIIFQLILLTIFIGVGLYIYTTQFSNANHNERIKEPIHQNYTQLINNWNKQVQNNTSNKQFLLSRESNDDLIEQLNEWMKNFYIPEITDLEKYNDFLEQNKFEKRTSFDTDMSGDDIRNKLKDVTNEKVVSGIVKKVLMMNDREFWSSVDR